MTAYPILVNTTEFVQTWTMTTNVIVWWDSMGQTVKTVGTMNLYNSDFRNLEDSDILLCL